MQLRPGPLEGRVRAPASKSYTHRAVILAAWSGNGLVRNPLRSDDTDATLRALRDLGFMVVHESEGTRVGGLAKPARRPIDVGMSGTTLRLMLGMAATIDGPSAFTLAPELARRPMAPLGAALRRLGARFEGDSPTLLVGGPLVGGRTEVQAEASSQFLSALLMAAPFARRGVEIGVVGDLTSAPYVDITTRVLRHHGLKIERSQEGWSVGAPQVARQRPFDVPGDWSSAAYLLAAAVASGGRVTIDGVRRDDVQGDRAILEHLRAFGARVEATPDGVAAEGGPLDAVDVDVGATPDLFPALAALAAFARGRSRLRGAPHLRLKESDRIAAMARLLTSFGVVARELPDGLEVEGGRARGAVIDAAGDHRIAMAGAILAMGAQGSSTLQNPRVVAKSYPSFFDHLVALAGRVTA